MKPSTCHHHRLCGCYGGDEDGENWNDASDDDGVAAPPADLVNVNPVTVEVVREIVLVVRHEIVSMLSVVSKILMTWSGD